MSLSCFYLDSTADDGSGNSAWQSTGITLTEGEAISMNVKGAATTIYNTDGAISAIGPNGAAYKIPGSLDPSIAGSSVIGRINGGAAFLVGEHLATTASEAGALELAFNDSEATDNKGGFFVSITLGT